MIQDHKARDGAIARELGIAQFARVVGYDTCGSPVELVFDLDTDTYEWHIGGEYVKDASPEVVTLTLSRPQCSADTSVDCKA